MPCSGYMRTPLCSLFFFNDTATTEIYTLSLHDALPILGAKRFTAAASCRSTGASFWLGTSRMLTLAVASAGMTVKVSMRSEEHTSELQSQSNLVCRLLLEKKKKQNI